MTISASPRGIIGTSAKGLYRGQSEEAPVSSDVLMPGEMPRRQFFRPCFSLRWGRRGRGKTLTLVADGYHFKQAYKARGLSNPKLRNGEENKYAWKVAANFHNEHADITRPDLVERLIEFPEWGWNMRIQIDEIAMYAHRRKWQLTSNLNLESFITQIRKRSIEPCGATQFPQRLDGDIVEQIDLFIDCDIEPRGCGNPEHTFCAAQRVHDWWGQWTGNTKRKPWPPNVWEYDYFKWFHNCGMFFGSYVTEEIMAPIWLKEADKNRIIRRQWGDETDLDADYEKWETEQAARAAAGISVTPAEMEDWEEYRPDLTIGAPGEDQLALFLRDKASRNPARLISLSLYLSEVRNINPNISTISELVEFCTKQRWEVKKQGNVAMAYIP